MVTEDDDDDDDEWVMGARQGPALLREYITK
jgi:hypothetical protein